MRKPRRIYSAGTPSLGVVLLVSCAVVLCVFVWPAYLGWGSGSVRSSSSEDATLLLGPGEVQFDASGRPDFVAKVTAPRPQLQDPQQQQHQHQQQQQQPAVGNQRAINFNPAVVVLTSLNGAKDRAPERERVLRALCSGYNKELLVKFGFAVYLSVDSTTDPGNGLIPASILHPVVQWWQRSSEEAGFPSTGTARIAAHYEFALARAFASHSHVIMLEDDLLPAPDFVSLFTPDSPAFQALEDANPERSNTWCVSAWNDMGVKSHAFSPTRLLRTDFFPGLGWMTNAATYHGFIKRKWPKKPTTGWDNWLRANNYHERDCIVPEVNRVQHISTSGTNVNDPGNHLYGVYSFASSSSSGSAPAPPPFELVGGSDARAYQNEMDARARAARRVDYYKSEHASLAVLARGESLLVIYERSTLAQVLLEIDARVPMKEPRGGKNGMILFPLHVAPRADEDRHPPVAFIILCDVVQCAPRLFPAEHFVDIQGGVIATSPFDTSCDSTCASMKRSCNDLSLQLISYPAGRACVIMRKYYACIAGCGHQVGTELPAYVDGENNTGHRKSHRKSTEEVPDTLDQCLVGDSEVPRCNAKHASTRRLCYCL